MAKVKVEGNTIDVPNDVCSSNKSLVDALLPFYPAVANADFKREGKGDDLVITVTKKAGTKGNYTSVIDALDAAPEVITPILIIAAEQKAVAPATLDNAILQMLDDEEEVKRVSTALSEAEPQSAAITPKGF